MIEIERQDQDNMIKWQEHHWQEQTRAIFQQNKSINIVVKKNNQGINRQWYYRKTNKDIERDYIQTNKNNKLIK